MDESIVQEILHELFSSLEHLDTQSSAILQFLKDKGIATDEGLVPYLERAGNASGVRWLAARVRIDHLVSGAIKAEEEKSKQQKSEQEQPKAEPPTDKRIERHAQLGEDKSQKESEKDATDNRKHQEVAAEGKVVADNSASDPDRDPTSKAEVKNGSTTNNSTKTSEKAA